MAMAIPLLSSVLLGSALWCIVTCQQLDKPLGPWKIVFKATAGVIPTGYNDIISFYQASGSLNDNDATQRKTLTSSGTSYKSEILDNWSNHAISAVRLSMYKNGVEQKYIVFDATGKTKNNWMDCNNILYSSYTDITSATFNFCDIDASTGNEKRKFFVNNADNGCTNTLGWMVMKDNNYLAGCTEWDVKIGTATPYFIYSTASTKTNWYSGSTATADALVVSVQAWDMVFKAIAGVATSQTGVRLLWKSSDTAAASTLSAKTTTTTPSTVYKSNIVENWSTHFIENVKYSMFTSGNEVGYCVFDGRGSDKNAWLADNKIKYSTKYTDIVSSSKANVGIDGDNNRRFTLHKEFGGCPNDRAWMEIIDKGDEANAPCSWDQNVATRPYFLYSNQNTAASCEENNAWNSANFPTAEVLGIFIQGWRPLLKVAKAQSVSPASSVYDLWTGTYTLNEDDTNAYSFAAGSKSLKSSVVDQWSSHYISAIRVSMFKSGEEVAFFVFDAHGSDKNNWFTASRLVYASYSDMPPSTSNFFSIEGHSSITRRFFIHHSYGGCPSDNGWICVVEGTACSWETRESRPYFVYSTQSTYQNSNSMGIADSFVVSAAMDNCKPNPCLNGGTCEDVSTGFVCYCAGNYFGNRCQNINGGWGSWSTWGSCSITCTWAGDGTQTRTRSCNNPTQQGTGTTCSGSGSEQQACSVPACIPDIDGGWSSWGAWAAVPVTCGTGTVERTRTCDNPAQSGKGLDCQGSNTSSQAYNLTPCPIDGQWSTWSSWTDCTKTCGSGTRLHTRTCTDPSAAYGGNDCVGDGSAQEACNTFGCSSCGTNEYLCNDGSCTFATRCDGYNDCSDGSDENGCTAAQVQMNPGYVNPDVERPSGAGKHIVSLLLVVGSLMTVIIGLKL